MLPLQLDARQAVDIFLGSVRDGFVQVSAFVAITVLLFGYLQYRTGGGSSSSSKTTSASSPSPADCSG